MIQKISSTPINESRQFLDCLRERLWSISGDSIPFSRPSCLSHFVQTFCNDELQTVSVIENEEMVAELSLVRSRRWKLFREFRSPNHPTVQCGALLTNKDRVNTRVFNNLASQVKALPSSFVTLDWVFDSVEMRRLVDSLRQAGCVVLREQQFETGFVNIEGDWDGYQATLSKSFRKKVRSLLKKVSQHGEIQFERFTELDNPHLRTQLLDEALDIEHRGWKGRSGSSLNSDQKTRELYLRMLTELAEAGQLEIQFLKVGEQRIAFEIGMVSNGTYYSHKVSYDPEFSKYSPGQLLMHFQLKCFFDSDEISAVDTVGELSRASAKWCNETRIRYRYVVSTNRFANGVLCCVRFCKPRLKRLLRRNPKTGDSV